MTTAQVIETSVTVNNNSPIQDYVHPVPDYQTQAIFGKYHLNHFKITLYTWYTSSFEGLS